MKRFLRTVIVDSSGYIHTARINLATGEIKPYSYRQEERIEPVGTINVDASRIPHWELIPAPVAPLFKAEQAKSSRGKRKANVNNVYLQEFDSLKEAAEVITCIDNVLTGAASLNTGAKQASNSLLFRLMRDIDEVSTQSIAAYTGYSEAYSRKLAALLRVACNAFDNEINA